MPIEIERKFLLAVTPDWDNPILRSAIIIEFEQIYLKVDDSTQERIRRSLRNGVSTYHYARLTPMGDATREVFEKELSPVEYKRARLARDLSRHIITKVRRCFNWKNQFFELDDIKSPNTRKCQLMEIQIDRRDQDVTLPDFLEFDREVTGEPAYSNASIALG